jgi:hypothetical protein
MTAASGGEQRHGEETPDSQRVTLPSPEPFPGIRTRVRSPGAYRIVNDEPIEEHPATRRSGRVVKAT